MKTSGIPSSGINQNFLSHICSHALFQNITKISGFYTFLNLINGEWIPWRKEDTFF